MAYDLVSSEYGWTDEVIGELPLGRFRQVTSAIQLRKFQETRQENHRFSWMTRNLSTFIAASYQVEGENKAIPIAMRLSLDEIELAQLEHEEQTAKDMPAADKNEDGSYERFLKFAQVEGKNKG